MSAKKFLKNKCKIELFFVSHTAVHRLLALFSTFSPLLPSIGHTQPDLRSDLAETSKKVLKNKQVISEIKWKAYENQEITARVIVISA